jgi:hypothetical protein
MDYCPHCSNPPTFYIVHYGPCDRVRAKEYYPNGTLKRVEYNDATPNIHIGNRVPGLHPGAIELYGDFGGEQ